MPGVQATNPFGVSFGAGSIQNMIEKKDRQTDRFAGNNNANGNGPSLNGGAQGASLTVVG